MSVETVNIAKKRRLAKAEGNHDRVKELNASFQREARRNKEKFYNDKSKMIEQSNSKGNTRDLFKTIRDITGTFTPRIVLGKTRKRACRIALHAAIHSCSGALYVSLYFSSVCHLRKSLVCTGTERRFRKLIH